MDENHYQALLEEVRNDIAEAKRTISELTSLESYLLGKLESAGGSSAKADGAQASARGSSRAAKEAGAKKTEAAPAGKGMQTVEFGPDGFPST